MIVSGNSQRIVIFDALVTEVRTERCDGVIVGRYEFPTRTFFIELIDKDGGRVGVWDGHSYADAIAAAEEWRRDGALVDDQVSDEGGCA